MICKDCQSVFLDLLLDPSAPSSAAARSHIESCTDCKREFKSLEATFALLDAWEAPEPSPYFDQKLAVRLREEQAMEPTGWFERLKARLLFNTGAAVPSCDRWRSCADPCGWWGNVRGSLWFFSSAPTDLCHGSGLADFRQERSDVTDDGSAAAGGCIGG